MRLLVFGKLNTGHQITGHFFRDIVFPGCISFLNEVIGRIFYTFHPVMDGMTLPAIDALKPYFLLSWCKALGLLLWV